MAVRALSALVLVLVVALVLLATSKLQPIEVQKLRVDDATFTVVDVEPTMP